MKSTILERYSQTEDGGYIIDITAGKISDLYNAFDRHTPYVRKELDQGLVDYISESASELDNEAFVIVFDLMEKPDNEMKQRITKSISSYYHYLKTTEINNLARIMRVSLIYLLIGVAITFLSVWVNQQLTEQASVTSRVFAEGLTVAAWVSLWEALATFLVNWSPFSRQIKLYERIANVPVYFDYQQGSVIRK